MPETKIFDPVRGSVIRVTKLDACGDPVTGTAVTVVTKKISSVAIEAVTEEGNSIRDRNFGDEVTVVDEAYTDTLGYTVTPTLMGVDPAALNVFTGNPTVVNAAGDIVGFDALTNIDLDEFGFALEVWSKIAGNVCNSAGFRQWGYTVFPFLKGGRLGGFSIENGLVSFGIEGAQTREAPGWGVGPYDVDRNAAGEPSPLNSPLPANVGFRSILVSLAPPVPTVGAVPLAAP